MNHQLRVARNILALLISQLGTWSVTLVLTLVVPPYLGASTYGLYSFVITYTGFFALVINLGASTYLTWRIAREPEQAPRLTFNALVMQIVLGLLFGVLALLLLPLLDGDPLVMATALLIMVATVLATLTGTASAALGGFQIMRTPAFIGLGSSALSAGLVLLVVSRNLGLIALVTAGTFTQVLATVLMLALAQRHIHLRPQLDFRLWGRIILGGLPFFGWSLILLFYWQIDIPLLKLFTSDAVVGWYALANRITGIPVFLPSIVITAILPALSHEHNAESPAFRSLSSRALRLVTAVGIPACIGTVLLAPTVIPLLHYPPSFKPAVPLIIILAFNMPVVALDMVLGTVLVALGRQKAWTLVGLVACIINPIVNFWAIPYTQHHYGNGAIGASLATLLSEVIMFVGAMWLRPRSVFSGGDVWYMVRCLLAAVIMLPAVGLGSQGGIHLYRSVAYGMFVYALAAYALQVVTNNDLKGLVLVISNRLGIETLEELQAISLGMLLRLRGGTRRRMARAGAVISRPLARTGAVVSQPLTRARAVVSQPLSQARAAVSQPLVHAAARIGAAANRYWPQEEAPVMSGSASYHAGTNGGHVDRYDSGTNGGYGGNHEHPGYTDPYGELPVTAPLPGREVDRRIAAGTHTQREEQARQAPSEISEEDVPTVPRHPRVLTGPRPVDITVREATQRAGH